VAASYQRASNNPQEMFGTPTRLFTWFDNYGIPREQSRYHWRYEVVEWVVPADARRNNSEGLISYSILLVAHEQVRWPARRPQGFLAMFYRPLQLLNRD
jgi:hypothetical protein